MSPASLPSQRVCVLCLRRHDEIPWGGESKPFFNLIVPSADVLADTPLISDEPQVLGERLPHKGIIGHLQHAYRT